MLSSEKKVYMLNEDGDHVELRWQNDKSVKSPAYGIIELTSDDGRYQCSIKHAFITELCVYIKACILRECFHLALSLTLLIH